MTPLQVAAGQLFIFNFEADTVTPEVIRFIETTRPGGVVLYGRNIRSAQQVRELNGDLQRLAARLEMPPLIIAVDEEGGRVSRMPAGLGDLIAPSQMAQAAAGGPAAAAACAQATALRLRRLGFTMNFAPVADVNTDAANPVIGSRAYGSCPADVAACVGAAVAAYLAAGIAPCAKHFPGHGDTHVDSHYGLPVVDKSLADMQATELVPFAQAIAAGVPAMMTAHVVYPQIDPSGRPATLSPDLLQQLLRRQMGFTGLLLTDALSMQAITAHYSTEEVTGWAVKGGACLLAPVSTLDAQAQRFEQLVRAAERGVYDAPAAAGLVADHKARFVTPLLAELLQPLNRAVVATQVEQEKATMARVAGQATTVLRNAGGVLPLTAAGAQRPLLIDFQLPLASPVEEGRQPGPILCRALEGYLPALRTVIRGATPTAFETADALQQAASADLLIVVVRNATQIPQQAHLVSQLVALGRPTVLVAARDPYDLSVGTGAQAQVATFGDPPRSMLALADLLCGRQPPTGRLPVAIPDLAPLGAGLATLGRDAA
ncbi:MAG TPA: glycoside hydrolase family 3 N-terminal domain-containing protein [Chloroflexia bacterium]|nr:glycoside hydrolase family 3 N-terminal domain-containing protein [Chloroflexia bacterium]